MVAYGISLQYTKIRKGGGYLHLHVILYPSHMTFQTLLLYKCSLTNYIPLSFSLSNLTNIIITYIKDINLLEIPLILYLN
jgi:hypothetical protein